MAIRLIALDLDGTLLNEQREISAANQKALSQASEKGIQIVITTGRRFASARPLLRELSCPAILVSSNGALVGTAEGEILRRDFLPRHAATDVLDLAGSHRTYAVAIYEVTGRGQVVMQNDASPDGPLGWYLTQARESLLQVPDLAASVLADPVHIMFGGPPSRLHPLEETLAQSSVGAKIHLAWTRYDARNIAILDVLNRGCSKGEALRWFVARSAIRPSEVMAIGDNFNDVEMLEFAGTPVLMANAPPGLARDGWQKTFSNQEDGVAAAVRTFAIG